MKRAVLVLLFAIVLEGCSGSESSESRSFRDCRESRLPVRCEEYLEDWPSGSHRSDVLAILEPAYLKLCLSDSGSSLSHCAKYVRQFPGSPHIVEVRRKRASLVWPVEDTINGYKYYLSLIENIERDDPHYEYVRDRLAKLEASDNAAWQATKTRGTLTAFAEYVRDHPNGAHLEEARAPLEAMKQREEQQKEQAAQKQDARRTASEEVLRRSREASLVSLYGPLVSASLRLPGKAAESRVTVQFPDGTKVEKDYLDNAYRVPGSRPTRLCYKNNDEAEFESCSGTLLHDGRNFIPMTYFEIIGDSHHLEQICTIGTAFTKNGGLYLMPGTEYPISCTFKTTGDANHQTGRIDKYINTLNVTLHSSSEGGGATLDLISGRLEYSGYR